MAATVNFISDFISLKLTIYCQSKHSQAKSRLKNLIWFQILKLSMKTPNFFKCSNFQIFQIVKPINHKQNSSKNILAYILLQIQWSDELFVWMPLVLFSQQPLGSLQQKFNWTSFLMLPHDQYDCRMTVDIDDLMIFQIFLWLMAYQLCRWFSIELKWKK